METTSRMRGVARSRLREELKFGELLRAWAEARQPAPKTLQGAERAVAQLKSLFGDIPVSDVKGEHLFEFRDAIALLPRTTSVSERRQDFADLISELAQAGDLRPKVRKATVAKQIRYIQTLVGYAYSERWIAQNDVRSIPAIGADSAKRRPFTSDEARAVFAQPFFTREWSTHESRGQVRDTTIRWLMILGLLTGARLEELGQIHVADVKTERGIAFIAIDDLGDDGALTDAKSVKTLSSQRKVPIHPRALDLGFLRFAEAARQAGRERLFDDLRRDRYACYTQMASRRCNRLIDRVTQDRTLVFHSFRHLYKDLCRNAGFLETVSDQLTGHAPVSVGGRYGKGVDLETLASHASRLRFDFVHWEPILRAA